MCLVSDWSIGRWARSEIGRSEQEPIFVEGLRTVLQVNQDLKLELEEGKVNERIRELAARADLACGATADNTTVMRGWEERFAELIIQDCERVANEHAAKLTGVASWSVDLAMQQVKKHFDIK